MLLILIIWSKIGYVSSVPQYFRPTNFGLTTLRTYLNIGPTTAVGRMFILFC